MFTHFLVGPRDANGLRVHRRPGFTLIELLIVIGIIAVMVSILIPSLSKARGQARIVKCQANLRSAGQGVQAFANDHNGFGQIWEMSGDPNWPRLDSARRRYVYDSIGRGVFQPMPWPVAYGPYWGEPNLRTEDCSIPEREWNRQLGSIGTRRSVRIMQCPSDRTLVGYYWTNPLSPGDNRRMFDLSYSMNVDIFGSITQIDGQHVWRNGGLNAGELGGQLDRVEGPGEVVMLTDAQPPDPRFGTDSPPQFPYSLHRIIGSIDGPWLADDSTANERPVRRHGVKGARNVGFVDGHVEFVRAVEWSDSGRPSRYSSNPRLSPYRVNELPTAAAATGLRGR